MNIEIDHEVEVENASGLEEKRALVIHVTYYSSGCPASMSGHPDRWTPAEASEVSYYVTDAETGERIDERSLGIDLYDFVVETMDDWDWACMLGD